MRLRSLCLAAALILRIDGAEAEEAGDPNRGLTYAKKVCAECHAVLPDEESSDFMAPTFTGVANTPGMTATALAVWLQSSHPTMPNLIISPADRDDVVAYIVSLKGKKP
jgi:mono/diheme cytochrome c family protein